MALTCLSLSVRADSTGIWRPGTANVLQPLNDVVLMPPKAVPCPWCKKFRKGKGPTGNEDPCRCCSCPGLFCEHAAPQSMPLSEPNSTAVAAITGGEGLVGIPLTSGGDEDQVRTVEEIDVH